MAGLSAAVRLCRAGVAVSVHEAAKFAGGRCRSFEDDHLLATIDNGTHLLLSGNEEVLDFLEITGGVQDVCMADRAAFDFYNVVDGARWCVDLGKGRGALTLLKWLHDKSRQPRGFSAFRFLKDLHALQAGGDKTVGACVKLGTPLYRNFWHPLTLAVLNAEPDIAPAKLLWAVMRKTVLRGGAYAKPIFAADGLGAMLVDPALAYMQGCGVEVAFRRRAQSIDLDGDAARSITFAHAAEILGDGDRIILAVPAYCVRDLLAGVDAPLDHQAILNVHYRLSTSVDAPSMIGLVGGQCEWLFRHGCIASATISGANAWMDRGAADIALQLWPEVAKVLGEAGDVPPYRVIKEKRATFVATPQTPRASTCTGMSNVFLAGDWTDTGYPATLEGAILSGRKAAEAALSSMD